MKFIHLTGHDLFVFNDILFFNDNNCHYQYTLKDGVVKITKEQYLLYKFGNNYMNLQKSLPEELCLYQIKQNYEGISILNLFRESIIRAYDSLYTLLWETAELLIDNVYGIEIDNVCFWLAYPSSQKIVKYSLSGRQKLFELSQLDGICYPENLFFWKNNLYICNMGTKELLALDVDNKLTIAKKFKEPIWEYIKTELNEYVKLDSGIYLL